MVGLHELGDMWVKVGSIIIFLGILLMLVSGKGDHESSVGQRPSERPGHKADQAAMVAV